MCHKEVYLPSIKSSPKKLLESAYWMSPCCPPETIVVAKSHARHLEAAKVGRREWKWMPRSKILNKALINSNPSFTRYASKFWTIHWYKRCLWNEIDLKCLIPPCKINWRFGEQKLWTVWLFGFAESMTFKHQILSIVHLKPTPKFRSLQGLGNLVLQGHNDVFLSDLSVSAGVQIVSP